MGRYYSTQNYNGKFGFGCQPSNDPEEVFGMEDISDCDDETEALYWMEGTYANIDDVRAKLNELYDELKIKKEDRIYFIKNDMEVWDMLEKYESKHFREFKKGIDKGIPYYSHKFDDGMIEIRPGVQLARCRIDLGTKILTELVKNGECELWEEL